MEKYQSLQSGSSAASPQQLGWKQGRLLKAICCAVIVALGYFAFIQLYSGGSAQSWVWKFTGSKTGSHGAASQNESGSLYLLGVGKADITGYVVEQYC
jgi:neutral ceramidase